VESTGLENRHTLIAYLGFKSLSLRHYSEASLEIARLSSFLTLGNLLGTGLNPLVERISALCHLRSLALSAFSLSTGYAATEVYNFIF
ncbi:hypothetical protein ACVZHJ_20690, partial [Vibrio diabolicus]